MSEKLSLERNFTRFFDDPTFPHKVTVCVGDKRISCSGALLAQQSSVLEKKFREDDGVLMFEELLDVNNSNSDGIMECMHYLHGAELRFRQETLHAVLKFSSVYQVENMFEQAHKWLENHLDQSKSVESALNFLKISRSLNKDHEAKIKSVICSFIRQNRELFGTECENYLDTEITGQDVILIIGENPVNAGNILKKWALLSVENGNFIAENHSNIDFAKAFPNSEQFLSFIATLSSTAGTADMLRKLLELQKTFFESQTLNESTSSEKPQTTVPEAGIGMPGFGFGTNFATSSNSRYLTTIGTVNTLNTPGPSYTYNSGYFPHPPSAVPINWDSLTYCKSDRSDESSGEEFTQLYIGNLPPNAEENAIKRMFSGFGKITDVRITFRNNGNNYGFISFENAKSAYNLLQRSQTREYELHGYTLKINVAHQQNTIDCEESSSSEEYSSDECDSDESSEEFTSTQLYIGNLPPNAEEHEIKRMFSGFGRITDVTITSRNRGKNFGFISFENSISAYNLLQRSATKDYELHGYILVINEAHQQH